MFSDARPDLDLGAEEARGAAEHVQIEQGAHAGERFAEAGSQPLPRGDVGGGVGDGGETLGLRDVEGALRVVALADDSKTGKA